MGSIVSLSPVAGRSCKPFLLFHPFAAVMTTVLPPRLPTATKQQHVPTTPVRSTQRACPRAKFDRNSKRKFPHYVQSYSLVSAFFGYVSGSIQKAHIRRRRFCQSLLLQSNSVNYLQEEALTFPASDITLLAAISEPPEIIEGRLGRQVADTLTTTRSLLLNYLPASTCRTANKTAIHRGEPR